jgi:hypothetical protein
MILNGLSSEAYIELLIQLEPNNSGSSGGPAHSTLSLGVICSCFHTQHIYSTLNNQHKFTREQAQWTSKCMLVYHICIKHIRRTSLGRAGQRSVVVCLSLTLVPRQVHREGKETKVLRVTRVHPRAAPGRNLIQFHAALL